MFSSMAAVAPFLPARLDGANKKLANKLAKLSVVEFELFTAAVFK
jgi:hypothetical protein